MHSKDEYPETDIYLLPYWFAGRVRDDTHHETLLIQGNEDEVVRSMLAAEVVDRRIVVTAREWAAMLHGKDLLPKETAFMDSGLIVSRPEVDAWVRQNWNFEKTPGTNDEFESLLLSCALNHPPTLCTASTERVSANGVRDRIYVGVVDTTNPAYQGDLWHAVYLAVLDYCDSHRMRTDSLPIFESVEIGWDWPVYYRDMIANSQLIWSASGDDIDLAALAAEQPRDR